jgi:selenide,water dikinase
MVAIGEVDPARMVTNAAVRPGDALVLTKPIGSGVIATAIKNDVAPEEVVAAAIDVMTTLNRGASEAMVAAGVRAGTDVTGFGLLGHLHRLLAASGVAARVRANAVPLIEGALALAEAGNVPGGTVRNLADVAASVSFAATVDQRTRTLLGDAQTSGGLLVAVAPERLNALLEALAGVAPVGAVIGEVVEGPPGRIEVG